jgi:hypothetical protein
MITGALHQIREGGRLCAAPDLGGSRPERFAGGRRGIVRAVFKRPRPVTGADL